MSEFTDNPYMKLVYRGRKYCVVASWLPSYIYTKGSKWLIFRNESNWELIYFWPSFRKVGIRKDTTRILVFKK